MCIPLLPAELAALCLPFLPLLLERLLGLRSDPVTFHQFSGVPETPFRMICHLPDFGFTRGAKDQAGIFLEDEFPYLLIPGLRAEGNLADRQLPFLYALKNPDPEGVFKRIPSDFPSCSSTVIARPPRPHRPAYPSRQGRRFCPCETRCSV